MGGYLAQGRFGDAIETATLARRRYPGQHRFAALEGLAYYFSDNLDLARVALNEAVELRDDVAVYRYNLAVVLLEMGDSKAAGDEISIVKRLAPASAIAMRANSLQAH